MSAEFAAYFLIATLSWLAALLLVKPRNAFDLSRGVGWYLLVFLVTYMLRPAGSQLIGDTFLYDVLRIGSFEEHWYLMAIAVPLAILSFAAGYAFGAPRGLRVAGNRQAESPAIVGKKQLRTLLCYMLAWGYFVAFITFGMGDTGAEQGDIAGATVGVYEHGTAWFAQGDAYVSIGSVLYYLLTGRLGLSLLLAGPWLLSRIIYGWGRNNIVAYLLALIAVYFGRFSRLSRPRIGQGILLMLAIFIFVVVFFPILSMTRALAKNTGMGAMDVFAIATKARMSYADILSALLSTHSSLTGFEPSLYHILVDKRPELGTEYFYYYIILPIPRVLWHGKGTPYDWPYWLLGIDWDPIPAMMGQASGSIGEAFKQWGWLGIPGEFLFTGWLVRWAEERARQKPEAAYVQLAYAGFYGFLPTLGRDSVISIIALRWLQVYGIAVFILWCIHKRATAQMASRYTR